MRRRGFRCRGRRRRRGFLLWSLLGCGIAVRCVVLARAGCRSAVGGAVCGRRVPRGVPHQGSGGQRDVLAGLVSHVEDAALGIEGEGQVGRGEPVRQLGQTRIVSSRTVLHHQQLGEAAVVRHQDQVHAGNDLRIESPGTIDDGLGDLAGPGQDHVMSTRREGDERAARRRVVLGGGDRGQLRTGRL